VIPVSDRVKKRAYAAQGPAGWNQAPTTTATKRRKTPMALASPTLPFRSRYM